MATIHQAQLQHALNSLIDKIPTFHGTPDNYFEWILKLENIATVTKLDPK